MTSETLTVVHATPGDTGPDATDAAVLAAAPVVVALVGVQFVGPSPWPAAPSVPHQGNGIQRRRQHAAVVLVGWPDQPTRWRAAGIDRDVAFTSRPAACRHSSNTWCRATHTPALCQSRRHRQQLMPEPQPISTGSISHGRPDFSTNRMPVRVARFDRRGRPPFGFGAPGGKSGAIATHKSSGTRGLAMPPQRAKNGSLGALNGSQRGATSYGRVGRVQSLQNRGTTATDIGSTFSICLMHLFDERDVGKRRLPLQTGIA